MALPKIILATRDKQLAQTARAALGGAVILSLTDSGEKALKALEGSHQYTVVVSDMLLSGMDGREFLAAVKDKCPKVARIAITGTPDFAQAVQLINTADISWLLTKPCDPKELLTAVTGSITRHRLDRAESDAMKDTLIGSVKMLVDIMELTHPEAVSRSKRIQRQAQALNQQLKAMPPQFMDMVVLLSNIGCMGLPPALVRRMEKGQDITKDDMKVFRTHPGIAGRLLENVPRMGKIADIIRHQNTPCSQNPPLGARILKACLDMDQLRIINKASPEKAIEHMRVRPEVYDPKVVMALARYQEASRKVQCPPSALADLKPGMIMQQDMVTEDGTVLLHKGDALSEASHIRLLTFNDLIRVKEPVFATLPGAASCVVPPSGE